MRTCMIGFACALLVACSVAPPAERDAVPTPIPIMESPIQTPAQPEQPTDVAAPPGAVMLDAPTVTVPTEPAPSPAPTGVPEPEAAPGNPAVVAAREALAKQLQIELAAVQVISVEEVQWPDGCLGVRIPGVFCIQVIVPGYRIVLEAGGRRYTYHTDLEGRQVVRADPRP